MSLLRRIRSNADDSPFGEPAPPAPPKPGPIRELWHHRATTSVYVVAMTRDNRFIIAGTRGGDVLFFDMAGRLLWHGRVEGSVYRIVLAEDADCFVVGTIDNAATRRGTPGTPGNNAYVWHFNGQLLHTFETAGATRGVDITPDGSCVAVGSLDKHLYVFDGEGEQVFKRELAGGVCDVALSHEGDHIFAAADGHMVCAFDRTGSERWQFEMPARPWAGVQVAHETGVLFVGANDNRVYCLDFAGQEHWRFDTGGHVNALAITPDGRICAAGGKANAVFVLNEHGNVLREHRMQEDVYGLTLSPDGQYLLIGTNDRQIRMVDLDHDRRVWQHETSGRVHAVAMTPSGRFFTAGTDGRSITVFNNTRVSDDMQELTLPDSPILTRMVLRMVRDDYTVALHIGLVRWFTEFERALRNNQFDVCRALLDLLNNDNGLDLSAEERQYTRSMEGAYWLFRGIAYHRNEQYDEARGCYVQSKAIQQALNNQDGVGQVIA
ncbi:MAG: PQQ-binding-like beta-propeller repeat protein, partial [Anaerolineae bacterium]|nr:PQQ-binding-like beta-propeller repeat protein [Anaerolineae bacterium]